ncbi:MAG TPA: protein-glutamate O-methyltransferase [Vicinamibacteria bacterium]|nr:protein-glutamate O-methyltransferase [Vicinamibacteria bacterium]
MTPSLGTAHGIGPITVSDRDFRSLTGFIYAEAGIRLGPTKKALLAGRLSRRLRELQLDSFGDYHRYLESHPEERVPLLDCITTNETQFFREPRQFEALERSILPRWREAAEAGRRPRRVRAWSAGCSSGEEPYSLAMTLLEQCPPESGWELEILATDVSTRVLRRAQEAVFPIERAAHIPDRLLKRFMLKGVRGQEGRMRAADELRRAVRFERLNLKEDEYPFGGGFDLILCRNVLIYFDQASKAHVLERLLARLAPEGHLFLGHAETLGPTQLPMRSVLPNVYARDGAPKS